MTSLTFFVVGVYLLLLRSSPVRQPGGGDEEGQQRGEEAVVGHRQHKPYQESWRRQEHVKTPTTEAAAVRYVTADSATLTL